MGISQRIVAALLFLPAAWLFTLPGRYAVAAEADGGGASVRMTPYLSIGAGVTEPENVRFMDGADAGKAALYGGENTFDDGSFDNGEQARLAAGVRFGAAYRLQLEYALVRDFGYSGNTNYRRSGEQQPSVATLDTRQILLAAFRDFAPWEYASGRELRPFLGIGAGITKFRLGDYRQQFPSPLNPNGSLRRGPAGEIPYTAIPPGSDTNFTAMLAAGVAFPVGESTELELSYRYADMGEIHTDVGEIVIARYRSSGSRREIPVTINETATDFRTHSLSLSLRFEW